MSDISADRAATAEVVVADPGKLQRVLSAVTLAFAADPPSRWLFPEADAYLQHFPTFIRGLGGPAVEQGTAFVTPDYAAVSLWLAPDAASDEALLGQLVEEQIAPEKQADVAAVIEQMGRYHPQEPHWYLPFIAVQPASQGQGLGGVLLRYALSVCDAAGLPAYLEFDEPAQPAPLRAARLRGHRRDQGRPVPADRADAAAGEGLSRRKLVTAVRARLRRTS